MAEFHWRRVGLANLATMLVVDPPPTPENQQSVDDRSLIDFLSSPISDH